MHTRILTLIAVPVLALGLAACGSSSKNSGASSASSTTAPASASTTSGAQITIDSGFAFHTTAVKAGDTVTVKNDSSSQHTVTADGAGGFNVTVDPGKTATFTAPAAGTYPFHCNIHNFMKGTLTVS